MNWCRIIDSKGYQVLVRLQYEDGVGFPYRYEFRTVVRTNVDEIKSQVEHMNQCETPALMWPLDGPMVQAKAAEFMARTVMQVHNANPLQWCAILQPIPGREQILAMQTPGSKLFLETQTGYGPFDKARFSFSFDHNQLTQVQCLLPLRVAQELYQELDRAQVKPWFKIHVTTGKAQLLVRKVFFREKAEPYAIVYSAMFETKSKLIPQTWPEHRLFFKTEQARDAAFEREDHPLMLQVVFRRLADYARKSSPIGHVASTDWARAHGTRVLIMKAAHYGVAIDDYTHVKLILSGSLEEQSKLYEDQH